MLDKHTVLCYYISRAPAPHTIRQDEASMNWVAFFFAYALFSSMDSGVALVYAIVVGIVFHSKKKGT